MIFLEQSVQSTEVLSQGPRSTTLTLLVFKNSTIFCFNSNPPWSEATNTLYPILDLLQRIYYEWLINLAIKEMKRSASGSSEADPTPKFWVDAFQKNSVVDWDVFIHVFSLFVDKNFRIKLEEVQKNQVKRLVDPNNQQEIRLKNWNNFLEDYWKLFKKHFKAVETEFENGFKGIQFTITITDPVKGSSQTITYVFKNSTIKYNNLNSNLKSKGFVTIGSSEQSDITINNLHINPTHFKLFKHPLGYKVKDVSKSNRSKLRINQELLLRSGMVLCLPNHEIHIVSARLNQLNPNDQGYINVPIGEELGYQVEDTTLTFIIKNTINQQQKKYSINYKKVFRIGKDPLSDAVLEDIKIQMSACSLVYTRQNWFLDPKQEVELYMGTQSQLGGLSDSQSLFVQTGMRVQFKDTCIDFKLMKN